MTSRPFRPPFPHAAQNPKRASGFSVVELMVVVAISLIMSVAIFGVLKAFEGRKRSTTSVNDVNQAGSYALYQLDKLIRSAGSGYSANAASTYGCRLNASVGGTQILPAATLASPFDKVPAIVNVPTAGSFRLAPVIIVPSAGYSGVGNSGSDVLIVMSGSAGYGEVNSYFKKAAAAPNVNLLNTLGFSSNDLILLADQPASTASTTNIEPCYIEQIGGTPTADQLPLSGSYYHASGTDKYTSGNAASINAISSSGMAFNIGNLTAGTLNLPNFQLVGLDATNTLYSYDLLNAVSATPQAIADGIYDMRAVYGISASSTLGSAITWVAPTGAYAPAALLAGTVAANAALQKIRAIRIGLVLRTSAPENTQVTTSPLTMFSDLTAGNPAPSYSKTLSASYPSTYPSERNYRYRIIESSIPIRNTLLN
ncbi:PilW family protein [Andreprevotia chitinilytica]|uniref:PilW family protein n=1 Tax=Andreprevotia chitinilytica TaxID=396808 RepID=UPI000A0360F5|nr:PilW family protein [Andreprevotia chitinilytica]